MNKTKNLLIIAIISSLLILIFLNNKSFLGDPLRSSVTDSVVINDVSYYAVQLQDITYYGKITAVNDHFLTLIKVYYPNPDNASQLIDKSSESHSPESMDINLTKIISIELLSENSPVLNAINEYSN